MNRGIAPLVDRLPLLGSDHVAGDLLLADGAGTEELVPVQEGHDPLEGVGLALVRGRREQQEERGGFGEGLAQPVAGDQFRAASQPVGLVADDQVPAGGDEVAQALLVVGFELLSGPAPTPLHRLDGVDGADDLIEVPPDVLGAGQVAPEGELAGRQELELLVEVGPHLLDPLRDQPLRCDDQDSLDQSPELEFPENQPRFDRLPQTDLIGQQVADAVVGHRPRQGVELVRQRDHPGFAAVPAASPGSRRRRCGRRRRRRPGGRGSPSGAVPAKPGPRRGAAPRCSGGAPRPGRRCGSRRSPRRGCGRTPRDSG